MFEEIENTSISENLEGDKQIIDELVEGFNKDELTKLKKLASELMKEQNVHESSYKVLYRNAYKYIACRRLYKNEIETCTQKKILGDYISLETSRWTRLK